MMEPTPLRLQLIDNGWPAIPVRGKIPVVEGWQNYCRVLPSEDDIDRWRTSFANAQNTGIALGRFVAIDIDVVSDATLARELRALAIECFGETPLVRVGFAPKVALIYRAGGIVSTKRLKAACGNGDGIDVLSDGAQIVAYGTHPDTKRPYEWVGPSSPLDGPPGDAVPAIAEAQVEMFLNRAHILMPLGVGGAGRAGVRSQGSGSGFSIVRDEVSGLVTDGREGFLTQCIYQAYTALTLSNDPITADAVSVLGWAKFTDPERGADIRDGKWTKRDADKKARSIVNKARNGYLKLRAIGGS